MNFQDLKIIVSQIKKKISCPKCKSKYSDQDIEIIGNLGDEQSFFHAICPGCEMEAVVNVSIQFDDIESQLPEGANGVQNFKKLGSAPRLGKVSMNEVLDIHNFLKDFNGDFTQMFDVKK